MSTENEPNVPIVDDVRILAAALLIAYGPDAREIADRQREAAAGDIRKMWDAILKLLPRKPNESVE